MTWLLAYSEGTMRLVTTVTLLLMLLLSIATNGAAQQWPKFRGVNAGSVTDDPTLPDTWSETENVAWKIDIPGLSWSSPIVWDDHIFVTTAISAADDEVQPIPGLYDPGEHNGSVPASGENRWMVYDIDFGTGAVRWATELHRAVPTITRHLKNSYASETPVTDGERLYVYFGAIGMVAALDFDGEVLWAKDTGTFNTMQAMATASSPALHENRLYVLNDNTTSRFSPRSTPPPARRSGGSTARKAGIPGPRRWCGRTACAPRSSPRPAVGSARTTSTAACCGS